MENKSTETSRTYKWYTTHNFFPGESKPYTTGECVNDSSPKTHQENLKELGVLDLVPTFENFKPLIDMYEEWWKTVEQDWSNFTSEVHE